MKLMIRCYPGDEVPAWYGLAYREWNTESLVLYLVPLNLLVRWWRSFRRWYKIGPSPTPNEKAAYQKGYKDGQNERR